MDDGIRWFIVAFEVYGSEKVKYTSFLFVSIIYMIWTITLF